MTNNCSNGSDDSTIIQNVNKNLNDIHNDSNERQLAIMTGDKQWQKMANGIVIRVNGDINIYH